MLFDTLTIVGVGLLGGSIGLAAKARGVSKTVIGWGRDPQKLEVARRLGAIDLATTEPKTALATADVVVFCTPVNLIASQMLAAAPFAKAGALFTDAGSTKGHIVRDVEQHLPAQLAFVGAHPLAGSEKQGVEFARAELFVNRICVLTPTQQTSPQHLEKATLFWQALGCQVAHLSPEEHDLALATTSHLPHFIASILAANLPTHWQQFAATGFRDTTRIAAGDPVLWTAIAQENALALLQTLDQFSHQLAALRSAVLKQDTDEISRLLAAGKKVRDALGTREPLGRA